MTRLVSVVVPVFNVAEYVATCLDSLLAQTYRNVEVLAIDDGSTDGSGDICDAYAAIHSRIRVLHKNNGGLSDARNAGLAAATGDWVMFLDADDWIDQTGVESMLQAAEETAADVVVVGYHVDLQDEAGAVVSTTRRVPAAFVLEGTVPHNFAVSAELMNIVGYAWNKLYRRSFLEEAELLFPVGISLVEDILFNAPVLARASRVAFLPDAFVHYVQRPRQTLGTKGHPDFATLMASASEATVKLLTAWGLSDSQIDAVIQETEWSRVEWALRSELASGGYFRSRRAAARRLLSDPVVRSVLIRELGLGRLRGPRRWIIASQARGHAIPTLLAVRLKEVMAR